MHLVPERVGDVAERMEHEPQWPSNWRTAQSSDLDPLGASSFDLAKFCRRNGLNVLVPTDFRGLPVVTKSLKVIINAENDGTCWKHLFRFFGGYEQLLVQGSAGTKVEVSMQLLLRLPSSVKAVEIDKETVMVRLELGLPYSLLASLNLTFLSLSIVPTARLLVQALLFNLPHTLHTLVLGGMAEMYAEDLSKLPPHLARLHLSSVIEIHHSIALCLPNNLRFLQLPLLVATKEIFYLMSDGYDVTEEQSTTQMAAPSLPPLPFPGPPLVRSSAPSKPLLSDTSSKTKSHLQRKDRPSSEASTTWPFAQQSSSSKSPSLSPPSTRPTSTHLSSSSMPVLLSLDHGSGAEDASTGPKEAKLERRWKSDQVLPSAADRSLLHRSFIKELPRRKTKRSLEEEKAPRKSLDRHLFLTVVIGHYWRINAESMSTPDPIPKLAEIPLWRDASRKRPPWLHLPQNPFHSCFFLPYLRKSNPSNSNKRISIAQKARMTRPEHESLLKNVHAYLLLEPRDATQIGPERRDPTAQGAAKQLSAEERMKIPLRFSCFSNPCFVVQGPRGEIWWKKGFDCVGAEHNNDYKPSIQRSKMKPSHRASSKSNR